MKSLKIEILCLVIIGLCTGWIFDANAAAEEQPYKGITLVLSSHRGPSTDAYESLIPEFEKKYGAKVNFEIGPYRALRAKHFTEAAAHTGAFDVISFPHVELGAYVQGGVIENLTPYLEDPKLADPEYDIEDFVPFVLDADGLYEVDGKDGRYALPYKFDIFIAMYRKDIFSKYDIPSPGSLTYDEIYKAAGKMAAEIKDGVYPVVLPLKSPIAAFTPWSSILISNGGDFFDENKYPLFQKDAGVNALNYIKSLSPYMPSDISSYDFDVANNFFAEGKAAYSLNWHAYFPVVLDPKKSKVVDKVGFDLSPMGATRQAQQLGGWAVGISPDSKHKEAAFRLIQFLTSKKNAVKFALNGGSTPRKSVSDDPRVLEKIPYYPLLIKALELAFRKPNDPSWPASQDFMGIAIGNALTGKDAKDEMNMAARKAYREVEKFGYSPGKSGPIPK